METEIKVQKATFHSLVKHLKSEKITFNSKIISPHKKKVTMKETAKQEIIHLEVTVH